MTDKEILNGIVIPLAYAAHDGQFRFDGVTPYILHPKAVADSFPEYEYRLRMVAWLHDVLEDTKVTEIELLKAGVPIEVVAAVGVLTKVPGEDYDLYLIRVKNNPLARMVKLMDMLANLSDSPTQKQVKKYAKGIKFLISA